METRHLTNEDEGGGGGGHMTPVEAGHLRRRELGPLRFIVCFTYDTTVLIWTLPGGDLPSLVTQDHHISSFDVSIGISISKSHEEQR